MKRPSAPATADDAGVAQDLLDPRTISKREMRNQVNLYMSTVMGEEPVRPDLVDFDDAKGW